MASNPQKRDYSITGPENQRAQERDSRQPSGIRVQSPVSA